MAAQKNIRSDILVFTLIVLTLLIVPAPNILQPNPFPVWSCKFDFTIKHRDDKTLNQSNYL